jgi:uncharacterized cupredoxin-like copper-binding protein
MAAWGGVSMRIRLLSVVVVVLLAAAGLTSCGATAGTPSATTTSQTITVTLTDGAITSSQVAFAPGTRGHFVVTDHGTQPHQFWLRPQNMQEIMQNMPMAQWYHQLLYNSQTVAPGQTVTFNYTFPMMSPQQGLAFGCYTKPGQPVSMMPIRISKS